MTDAVSIRVIHEDEYPLLADFTYAAIFLPEGVAPPPRSILDVPELCAYYEDFGQEGDLGVVAEADGRIIGAAWLRIAGSFGSIDEGVPELAISVQPEHRGQRIGTRLLDRLLDLAGERGVTRVTLSVQKDNFAVRMYERAGFAVVDERDGEYIMACDLAVR